MARKASGVDQLARARLALRTAKSADELRAAQAVVLPLALGLSLKQTAQAIGRSVSATCSLRIRYCQVARGERKASRGKRALRNRANLAWEREARTIEKALKAAARAGSALVPALKVKLEKALGKPLALSTIYRMLARHGWRTLASDAPHPKDNRNAPDARSTGGWYKS
jgi:hypothetical protein